MTPTRTPAPPLARARTPARVPARLARGTLGVALAAGVIEAVSRTGLVDSSALPPASDFLRSAAELGVNGDFLADVLATLKAWAGGLLLAVVVAVPAGVLLGQTPWLGAASRIVVELCRPVPSVALIPLALIVFSSATEMKMSLVFYAGLWPILINTLYALRDVDPIAKDTMRSFGFGPLSVLWWVTLPSAAPFVATGVRISASVGLIVIISAELLAGGEDGIGTFLMESQSGGGDTAVMLAGAVWAGLIGLAVNIALLRVDRWAFGWHQRRNGAG